jgi:AhpD family alkylhydroperoxidase
MMTQPRINNPAMTFPEAFQGLTKLRASIRDAGIPETTQLLIDVRASQINSCGVCLDMHTRELKHAGEPAERIALIAAWREAPYYTDAERAALALAEAATRLADRSDPVPVEVWIEASRHYTQDQLAALVIAIATINTWNRLQAVTRQVGGDWVEGAIAKTPRAV